jgi:DNA invertase Pin-like site-specific DNA recombinase
VLTTDRYTIKRQTYETTGTLRIVVYARLSKNRSGLSTNTSIQVTECLTEAQYYARQSGLKLEIVGIYEENDVSASKYSKKPRPDYLDILELIRANQVDVIFSTEMERLCRLPREMEDIIDLSEATDLRCIYFTSDDSYDLRTINGISRARDAVNRADRESRKISERIKRKLADRASEGASHGGRRAYGYKPGGMEVEEHEAAIIRQMGDMVLAGKSCREVAYWANEQGHPTAEGKLWPAVSVQNMLRRPRYVGIRVHKGVQYKAKWPAVFVDREQWDKIQPPLLSGCGVSSAPEM